MRIIIQTIICKIIFFIVVLQNYLEELKAVDQQVLSNMNLRDPKTALDV